MPLPKPRADENESDFVSRCTVDFTMVNEYQDQEQRLAVCYNLYEGQKTIKRAKDNWQNAFEKTLDKAERDAVRDFTNYYKTETDKAVNIMLQKNSINEQDLLGLFTNDGFAKRYEALYESIGLTFANWYAKNFDKYITKGVSPNQFQEPWRAAFRNQGILVGAQRVSLVQNTAKKTLIKVYKQLANDPIFESEGEVVRAKMLRQQFDRYNKYQAERLVRTEATNAANYATMQSAQDIFPGADMQKEWISASDERTRAAHREANGQIVDFNKPFIVKGEELMRPGDPSGSASNVINCRCSMAPFPKEGANTTDLITDINIGLAISAAEELLQGKMRKSSYNDYPQSVSNNAKRGIELNKKVNNRCATDVGKIRAQQLANREKLSVKTIKRMYSYLSRAAEYYNPGDNEACGTISYLLWGGKAGLRWSKSKLNELGELD